MIKVIVSVKDRLTGFKSLMVEENVAVAKRNFKQALTQQLYVDKSDFELYNMGTYDTTSGNFDIFACPVLLMTGNEVTNNVSNAI